MWFKNRRRVLAGVGKSLQVPCTGGKAAQRCTSTETGRWACVGVGNGGMGDAAWVLHWDPTASNEGVAGHVGF
jgi:hypothetical protein